MSVCLGGDYVASPLTLDCQGKQLQTGFLKGMEFSLGVTEKHVSSKSATKRAAEELGEDAVEADELSEATKDVARARYQRLFWEPVVEGKVCNPHCSSPSLIFTAATASHNVSRFGARRCRRRELLESS